MLNRQILYKHASTLPARAVYQATAMAVNSMQPERENRFLSVDDDQTQKIPFFFQFVIGSPIMFTTRIPELEKSRVVANGQLGVIVGYACKRKGSNSEFEVSAEVNGITMKRFRKLPDFLLIKIRNSKKAYSSLLPLGVITVPPLKKACATKLGPQIGQPPWCPTITQFPLILSYAVTPEKIQ